MDAMSEGMSWSTRTTSEAGESQDPTANLHAIIQTARQRIEEAKAEGAAPELTDVVPRQSSVGRMVSGLRRVTAAAKNKPPVALGIAGAAVGLVASVFLPWGRKHRERA